MAPLVVVQMSEQLVRDLLDANVKLTAQVVELARAVIGAPQEQVRYESNYGEAGTTQSQPDPFPFAMSEDDNWDDIPEDPEAPEQNQPRPRLHTTEEEEDAQHLYELGQITREQLDGVIKRVGLQNHEIVLDGA